MTLEDVIFELLSELGDVVGSVVIGGVPGFLPAFVIAERLLLRGLLADKGGGRPTKRQLAYISAILQGNPDKFVTSRKGRRYYYKLR